MYVAFYFYLKMVFPNFNFFISYFNLTSYLLTSHLFLAYIFSTSNHSAT